jgi:MSHA biogenesis protein MshQ
VEKSTGVRIVRHRKSGVQLHGRSCADDARRENYPATCELSYFVLGNIDIPMIKLPARTVRAYRAVLVLAGLLLWPALSSAAITFAGGSAVDGGANTQTTASIARPAGATVGSFLIVQLAVRTAATTITAPAGWTLLRRDTSGATLSSAIYYKFYAAGDATPIAFTLGTASRYVIGILAYDGVDPTNPIDANAGRTNASSTTLTAPSVTETENNDQEIWFYSHARSGNINTPPSDGATRYRDVSTNGTATNNVAILAADNAQTTATTTGTSTATHASAAINIGQTVALAPLIQLRAEYLMEQNWNGTAGEVLDTSGNSFNGTAVAGATTAAATPANGANPGTCRYGVLSGGATASRLNMGGAQLGIGGGVGVTVMAWARWGITPSTGNNWGALVTNQSTTTADTGQIWLEESQTNANWEFAVSTTVGRVYVFSTAVPAANTWTHVAGVYDGAQIRIYVNGVLSGTVAHSGKITADSAAYILNVGSWAFNSSNYRSFQGFIDEARVYDGALNAADIVAAKNITRPCLLIDHYRVQNNASGVNCQAEPVTITAHTVAHAATSADGQTITITANRVSGAAGTHGDFALTTGTGILNNGAADDGVATYTFGVGENSVVLSYKNTWVQTVNFAVTDGVVTDTMGTASADAGYNQDLAFVNSGFRITDGGATPAAATIATQTAGTTSATYGLQAIRTDTNTGACVGVFASGTDVTVDLASQCNNPIACIAGQNVTITNNAVAGTIAPNPNAAVTTYTSRSLRFGANSQALFTLNYPDVGAISLYARYSIPLGTGPSSGNLMTGTSNSFVVKPAGFTIANTAPNQIKRTSDGFVNPAAASAAGTAFIAAGDNFSVTVTAVNSSGAATPNYGKEISPETVMLTPNLVGGLGLTNNPTLTNPTAFGGFSGGSATGTTFGWGDVGIITLTPSVGDADYLGAGDVTGTASGNVGRFYPKNFVLTGTSTLTNRSAASCSPASIFTYMGEGLSLGFTLVARNASGVTTQNYSGAFAKLGIGTFSNFVFGARSGATDLTTRVDSSVSPTGSWASGVAAVTAVTGIVRNPLGTLDGPFTGLQFGIAPVDSDGVAMSAFDFDADGNAVNERVKVGTTTEARFGRMRLNNAFGSTLLDLPLPLSIESYTSAGVFATNPDDSCTTLLGSNLRFAYVAGTPNLTACETAINPAGTINFFQGRASSTSASLAPIKLIKPGSGNDGAVDVTVNLNGASGNTCTAVGVASPAATNANKPWLLGNWGTTTYTANPTGRATFGLFKSADQFIYLREVY